MIAKVFLRILPATTALVWGSTAAADLIHAGTPEAPSAGTDVPALPSGSSDEFRNRMLGWTGQSPDGPIRATERVSGRSADLRRLAISSPFGWRTDPIKGLRRVHSGVDLPGPFGARVFATAGGIVRIAGHARGYGNLVEIEHSDGVRTRYGHLARIRVAPSQRVGQGQLIGDMGSTGRSTGVHLHYEVRVHGRPVDPLRFIGQTSTVYETVWAGHRTVRPHWTGWSDVRSADALPQARIN